MIVSLVGETQAKSGTVFIFRGPLSECRDCKRKTVCFNLEGGVLYEVISVREKHHDCNIHEGGVRVVELKKAPVKTTLDAKSAIEGSTVSINEKECSNLGCENYGMCFILEPKSNRKYRITTVIDDVECPSGWGLKSVILEE